MNTDNSPQSPINWGPMLLCLVVGLAVWVFPHPAAISNEGWTLTAIFLAMVLAVVSKPLPLGVSALISLILINLSGTLSFAESFSAFSQPIVWLVVFAFFIARGFIVTGLGARMAYLAVERVGKRTLGMAYALALSDLLFAPAIPSVTARCGGVIFPIVQSLARAFDSKPHDPSRQKLGSYLVMTAYQVSAITSAMFVTAMAANPLVVSLAAGAGVELTWTSWALAASVPGILSLIMVPYLIYLIRPPGVRYTPEAPAVARKHLAELGPVKRQEWIMLATFLLLLVLWVFGSALSLSATVAAMIGLTILVLAGVLDWKDLLRQSDAWETYIWFSALIMMASKLNEFGVIAYFSNEVMHMLSGNSWFVVLGLAVSIYFYSHYFFASATAHVGAMYTGFLLLCIGAGAPPILAALVFAFSSNLFACLTHYGSAPGPLLYGAGYVSLKDWWAVGFAVSICHLVIWGGVGSMWWKVLGLW